MNITPKFLCIHSESKVNVHSPFFCGTLEPSRKYSNLYHLHLTDRCFAEAEHCTMLSRSFVCGRRSICVGKTCYTKEVSPGNQSQAPACGHSRALDKSSPRMPLWCSTSFRRKLIFFRIRNFSIASYSARLQQSIYRWGADGTSLNIFETVPEFRKKKDYEHLPCFQNVCRGILE
jgi:hypothetical protein